MNTPNSQAATIDGQDKDVVIELGRNSEATFDSVVFVGDDDIKDGTVGAHPNGYTLYARTQGIDLSQVTLSINDVVLSEDSVNIHQTGDGNTDINYTTHIKAVSSANAYHISGKIIYTVVENTADQSAYYNQSVNWIPCYSSSDPRDQNVVYQQKVTDYDGKPEFDEITGYPKVDTSTTPVPNYTNYECAKITAPVNYYDQYTSSITLALARYKHTGLDDDKLGSIILNPGGPGESGIGLIAGGQGKVFAEGTWAPAVGGISTVAMPNYDIASFDPRGVGRSTQLVCDPYTGDLAAQIASCKENTPNTELLSFLDTVTHAHDLDLVRSLLGDTKLNYMGFSWGSMLGAAYSGLFPDKIGHVYLDGIVPYENGHSIFGYTVNHARVFELNAVVNDVLTQCTSYFSSICPFTGSLEAKRKQLNDLFDESIEFDSSMGLALQLFDLITTGFSDADICTLIGKLAAAQTQLIAAGMGRGLNLGAIKQLISTPAAIADTSNRMNNRYISCLDESITPENTLDIQNYAMQSFADIPTFGGGAAQLLATANPCPGIPLRTTPDPNYGNIDLPAILLSHSSIDFNTPAALAQRVKEQAPNSIMVHYLGSGHCSYKYSAELMGDVNTFFNTGVKPSDGKEYPRHLQGPGGLLTSPTPASAPAPQLPLDLDDGTDSPAPELGKDVDDSSDE